MKNGKNVRGVLSYNEAKVRRGDAELILASRFGCEASELSFSQKLTRFEKLNQDCIRSGYNAVHISLNFHAQELISTDKMADIAQAYMQQLGFEKQPYLVYRHTDAAHPHLHIVTTPVRPNGSFISLHNLVQRKSEPARKQIEQTYGLVKADGRQENQTLTDFELQRADYGKADTKQVISQIVRTVFNTYRFTSFEEYRLMLKDYGVFADKGAEGTRLNRFGGLQYSLMDAKGNKQGIPIKASSIYERPTLKNIGARFTRNEVYKESKKAFTQNTVRYCCKMSQNRQQLVSMLFDKKISLSKNEADKFVLIDHRNKAVFTDKELGVEKELRHSLEWNFTSSLAGNFLPLSLMEQLASNAYSGQELSSEFLKRKKKKKRK